MKYKYSKSGNYLIRKRGTFAGKLLNGMASASEVYTCRDYRYPHRSTAEALGGDCARVGSDMTSAVRVVGREIHDGRQKKRA